MNKQKDVVFISYAQEDSEAARRIYKELKRAGLNPWLDDELLLPGQIWGDEIKKAISKSKFFIVLLSSKTAKERYAVKQLRMAMDVLNSAIPVRLDSCEIPYEKLKDIEYVDLFPDWNKGILRILQVMGLTEDIYIKQQNENLEKEGNYSFEFAIEEADIVTFSSDVIALKYAQDFYGADLDVSSILNKEGVDQDSLRPLPNQYCYVESTDSIKALHVLFVGVPPHEAFEYKGVREFSKQVVNIVSKELHNVEHIAMTIHGRGFGLDEVESFLAQFAGLQDGMLAAHQLL
jgi:hypothetical protein